MNEKRAIELAAEMREMISIGWTIDTFDKDFDECDSDTWNHDEKEDCRKIFLQVWDQVQEEKNMQEITIKLQFESGEGLHFFNGVNFLYGEAGDFYVYAEVKLPNGISDDYGYLSMKKAILQEIAGRDIKVEFPYDGQEQYLASDASEGEDFIYTDICLGA